MKKGCDQCPSINKHDDSGARCCDDVFCSIARMHFQAMGEHYDEVPIEERIDETVQYLSKKGCVIAPEHRPFCTMFACPQVLATDRSFRREYERVHEKLRQDHEINMLREMMGPALQHLGRSVLSGNRDFKEMPEAAEMVYSTIKFKKNGA